MGEDRFAGIDWAGEEHAVCVVDAGLRVIAVHPNQVAAMRPRCSAAGGKSDDFDSPIALAFLKRYPAPVDARGLGEQRMARFLARHRYCGRRPARELPARLNGAAEGRAGQLETEARRQIVVGLVAALEPFVARIAELTGEIRAALAEHTDGPTFRSLFCDPKTAVCPATMLAEIGIRNAIATTADTSRHHNPWAADVYQRARAHRESHATPPATPSDASRRPYVAAAPSPCELTPLATPRAAAVTTSVAFSAPATP